MDGEFVCVCVLVCVYRFAFPVLSCVFVFVCSSDLPLPPFLSFNNTSVSCSQRNNQRRVSDGGRREEEKQRDGGKVGGGQGGREGEGDF